MCFHTKHPGWICETLIRSRFLGCIGQKHDAVTDAGMQNLNILEACHKLATGHTKALIRHNLVLLLTDLFFHTFTRLTMISTR